MSHQSAPVSFTERVYTLSNLIHTTKTPTTNPSNHPAHQRKNLRLLDNIALLLLTQPSPDVAAVALERRTTQAIFYYTKLHSSTSTEQAYIHDLITTLQGPTNKNNYQIIISKVVKACRAKILSRLTKLKTAILTAAPRSLNIDTDSVVHRYFEKQLGSWYTGYESPQQFMERYLSHIRLLVPNERDDLELQQIIRVAHITSSYIPSTTVFPNMEIAKRVGRVGEWYGAVTRVVNAARAIKRHGVEIVFIQVPPQGPERVIIPADYMHTLNRYARECHLFSSTCPVSAQTQLVTQSVHVECALAVYLTTLHRTWSFVEIGCSKPSCWLCEMYLLQDKGSMFRMSRVHRKLQPGWMMPREEGVEMNKYVSQVVDGEMMKILKKEGLMVGGEE